LWVTITAPAKRIYFELPLCRIQAKQPPKFLTFFFMPNGNTKRTFLSESHFFIMAAHLIRIAQKKGGPTACQPIFIHNFPPPCFT